MAERPARAPRSPDSLLSDIGNLGFGVAQAMAAVIVPLLAVDVGHPVASVGLIVSVAAVSQTLARLAMGAMMSRFTTKFFIITAVMLLAASCLVLASTTDLWAFVLSQLLQGAARAYFWTGSQTHVVRGSNSAVDALARLNVVQGIGQLGGPAIAGLLGAWSLQGALLVAGAVSALTVFPVLFLTRFPPFARKRKQDGGQGMLSQPGIRTAASMTAVAGAWRGILNSYLPVILTGAGYSVPAAGLLITVTNLTSLAGSAIASRVQARSIRFATVGGIASTGLGLALVAFLPTPLAIAVLALAVSGLGAGVLQTVGPALAADSVSEHDQGRAIATIGIFRSVSLLASPLAAAGLVLILPGTAMAAGVAGIIIAIPALAGLRGGPTQDPLSEKDSNE
ncbi:MFS transporter [Arthrobacter sp. TMS1-12-1]